MGTYVGVDWASKRWILTVDDGEELTVETAPSMQAAWDRYAGAELILVDIPIGLSERESEHPRTCDEEAAKFVSGVRTSSVFSVPSRNAVHAPTHKAAEEANEADLGEESVGPQSWGLAERVFEVDVFMQQTDPGNVRESHPEVAFEGLDTTGVIDARKSTDAGLRQRRTVLGGHDSRFEKTFESVRDRIIETAPWKRRLGIGMLDDILDSMALALTARMGNEMEFSVFGDGTDTKGLPMEIVYHEAKQ